MMNKPETKSAFLVNSKGRATLHVFESVELRHVGDDTGVALLYRCRETGELRVWGFENPQHVRRFAS